MQSSMISSPRRDVKTRIAYDRLTDRQRGITQAWTFSNSRANELNKQVNILQWIYLYLLYNIQNIYWFEHIHMYEAGGSFDMKDT